MPPSLDLPGPRTYLFPVQRSPEEPDHARPRLAATLVVVRDSAEGPQILMTKRLADLRFMGGAFVFPGGAMSPGDSDPGWARASALTLEEARAALDAPEGLGAFVCALREAFE